VYLRLNYDCKQPGHLLFYLNFVDAEFLLYNGLTARLEESVPDAFFSSAIIDYAYSHYRNMLPLHRWLKKMMDGSY
jgi:hypothetical protein